MILPLAKSVYTKGSIAIGEIGYGMRLNYKILDAWVMDPKGSEKEIMRAYQKHWRNDCFQSDADIRSALGFLYKLGDLERVGAYCRNRAMERFREDPEAYLKEYHKRSKSESTNSQLKEKLDLERGIPKGAVRAGQHFLLCILARNLVALTRLQHGVTENLTSVAYLS